MSKNTNRITKQCLELDDNFSSSPVDNGKFGKSRSFLKM